MKIKKIDITNYRTIRKLSVNFYDDITLIVGKNNIGKSNVLKSIEIFFSFLDSGSSKELKKEDFKINSTQICISVTFCDMDKFVNNLKKDLFVEAEKKRSNKEKIKQIEILYRTFELLKNRFQEIEIKLTIPRSNLAEFKIEVTPNKSVVKKTKYVEIFNKRHYAEKHLIDILKEKQTSKLNNWSKCQMLCMS